MRRVLLHSATVAFVIAAGCNPGGLGPVSRKNELKIENRSGSQLSRVTVKWAGKDLVWEKLCSECQGTERWAGRPCETCKGTGSRISTRDTNVIFKLPISKSTDTSFQIEAAFLDGQNAAFKHPTTLNPAERKRITATIGRDFKIAVREKKRNPHIE
jgi:DnaJ-class molecular chaperone